jgi:hypothetical protein
VFHASVEGRIRHALLNISCAWDSRNTLYHITTAVQRQMKTGYELLVLEHGAICACRNGLFSKADLFNFYCSISVL